MHDENVIVNSETLFFIDTVFLYNSPFCSLNNFGFARGVIELNEDRLFIFLSSCITTAGMGML